MNESLFREGLEALLDRLIVERDLANEQIRTLQDVLDQSESHAKPRSARKARAIAPKPFTPGELEEIRATQRTLDEAIAAAPKVKRNLVADPKDCQRLYERRCTRVMEANRRVEEADE